MSKKKSCETIATNLFALRCFALLYCLGSHAGIIILYVDNDAARAAVIEGSSTPRPSSRIVDDFWILVAQFEVYIRVERVPSKSNIVDSHSRGDVKWVEEHGYVVENLKDLHPCPLWPDGQSGEGKDRMQRRADQLTKKVRQQDCGIAFA